MARARDTRLTRVAASAARSDSPANADRLALEAWAAVAAVVRDGVAQAGIDPAGIRALHLLPDLGSDRSVQFEEPGEEFVTSNSDGLAATFVDRLAGIVRAYEDGREPDFVNASLAELLAWCLWRKGKGSDKGAA